MNLRGVVAVSGKPGLFKVIGQNKSGFVLESLDAQKLKLVVNLSTAKLASLEDITVFGEDSDLKLPEIFNNMKDGSAVPDIKKADGKTLRVYFREVAPEHDEERVYASDMKKIVTWFNIIKELPLFTEEPATADAEDNAPETEEEVVTEPEAEKPAKTKAKAK
ncbi:hypothetical protein GS399_17230 [Pedobacter sp. HMF7647]|uniref:DUF5606 domain-containing protein n=1 Tax=Hufsiella arboris TaxID=2695275 RepID=A0A7K1YF81_9SPHI|nr:DUF5606 domain-containing protein [Hufsiella arboris]MXV52718.1 hypothetical protein [Hufsiella arboris]